MNFYLNIADQRILDSRLSQLGDVVFCKSKSMYSQPQILKSSLVLAMGSEPLGIFLVKKSHLQKVKFRKLENLNVFVIDTLTSPVIEYSRCFVSDEIIRRGRFYFIKSYIDEEGGVVTKDAEFLSWADRIYRRSKADLEYDGKSAYYGSNTLSDIRDGVKPVVM